MQAFTVHTDQDARGKAQSWGAVHAAQAWRTLSLQAMQDARCNSQPRTRRGLDQAGWQALTRQAR